jgi:hypothetical protein
MPSVNNSYKNPLVLSLMPDSHIMGNNFRDDKLRVDVITSKRLNERLTQIVPGWHLPLDGENSTQAYERYDSARKWLVENTRDRTKFPVVNAELIEYGKQKTLLGVKGIGVLISLILVIFQIAQCICTEICIHSMNQQIYRWIVCMLGFYFGAF